MTSTDTGIVLSGSTEYQGDTSEDDPPMCAHGTEESQGWCAQCEAGLPAPAPPIANPLWEPLNRLFDGDGELSEEEWEFLDNSTLGTLRDDEPK